MRAPMMDHDDQNCGCGFNRGDTIRVAGFQGVACFFRGHPSEWTDESAEDGEEGCEECNGTGIGFVFEPEQVENRERAIVVMVGDDARHTVDISDCAPLPELDYCHECGQMGCVGDGLDRSEQAEA